MGYDLTDTYFHTCNQSFLLLLQCLILFFLIALYRLFIFLQLLTFQNLKSVLRRDVRLHFTIKICSEAENEIHSIILFNL